MATWDFIQKQILLGDASTGKSSLLVRLTDDRFLQHSEPTIGVEFGSRLVQLTEGRDAGKKVKTGIWDTAGQESFRSITRSYYRGAGGALLVFDITSRPSFLSCRSWLADLREWGEESLVVLLVGNKGDLVGEAGEGMERAVTEEEAKAWVEEEGLVGYVETSAKSGNGVEEAFNEFTRTVHERYQASLATSSSAHRGGGTAGSGFSLSGAGKGASGCC